MEQRREQDDVIDGNQPEDTKFRIITIIGEGDDGDDTVLCLTESVIPEAESGSMTPDSTTVTAPASWVNRPIMHRSPEEIQEWREARNPEYWKKRDLEARKKKKTEAEKRTSTGIKVSAATKQRLIASRARKMKEKEDAVSNSSETRKVAPRAGPSGTANGQGGGGGNRSSSPEVIVLLDSDDDEEEGDPDFEMTELHLAVDRKDEEAVKELLQKGVDLNPKNYFEETPLYRAAMGEDKSLCLKFIKLLIDKGADPYLEDAEGCVFVHELVGKGTTITPSQFHELVEYLILVGKEFADLFNVPGEEHLSTPLHCAVENLEVQDDTLSLLRANLVDFNAKYVNGNSVLAAAIKGNRTPNCFSHLIKLGADWKHINDQKLNLLHLAADACNVIALNYFISLGLDVNAIDLWWDTPLHQAMKVGDPENLLETTKVLVANGADVRKENVDKLTPLAILEQRNDVTDKDKAEIAEVLENRKKYIKTINEFAGYYAEDLGGEED